MMQLSTQTKIKLLITPVVAVFFLLVLRLGHLQVVRGNYYHDLADENRYFRQKIPAARGVIFDRYQQPLVKNKKFYFLNQDDSLFSQREAIANDQALGLMTHDQDAISYELRRWYQFPWSLSHVLGYTAPADKDDLLAHDFLQVNDWMGQIGLEQEFDSTLRGRDGYRLYEVNTLGEKQRLIREQQPIVGQDINTSLDPYLNKILYQAMSDFIGSAVVLDASNGQVMALTNRPAFNANDLSFSLTDDNLEQQRQLNIQNYLHDERQVFFNRAISGTYPPGSIFKIVTAMAGLESGAFNENRTVLDEGVLKVGDYEYKNWYYTQRGGTDGEIALIRAIARSNDIYFYKAAEWTGPNKIADQARDFGLGQATGIELSPEASGLVSDPSWKEKQLGEPWYLGNTYHMGIGQGDILVTPLQMAQLVQTMANRGEKCQPRLTQDNLRENGSNHCQSLGLKDKNVTLVMEGMLDACQPKGTAFPLFKFSEGLNTEQLAWKQFNQGAIGCKTGTAEFGGEDEQGYRKTHGWLVAVTTVNQEEMLASLEKKITTDKEGGYLSQQELKQWRSLIQERGFPQKVAVVVLVESDDKEPFKEGSNHSAPVVAEMMEYLK